MAAIGAHVLPEPSDGRDDSVWIARMSDSERMLLCCKLCSGLLQEPPLLLACLHNCCQTCFTRLTTTAADGGGGQRFVLCPSCGVATDVASCRRNPFVATRLRAFLASVDGPPVCATCSADAAVTGGPPVGGGKTPVVGTPAQYWCVECNQFLCDGCRPWHDKFSERHTVGPAVPEAPSYRGLQRTGESAASVPTAPMCTPVRCLVHGTICEFFCIDCAGLRCSQCMKACLDAKHDVGDVTKTRVQAHGQRLIDDVRAQLGALRATAASRARACTGINSLLERARKHDVQRLKRNKKLAVNAVSRAFDLAHTALTRVHAALQADAERMATAEQRLMKRARDALAYVDVALCSKDVGSLLSQQQALLACLSVLEAELDLQQASRSNSLSSRWSVLDRQADDGGLLVEAIRKWIGWPREHAGFPLVCDSTAVANAAPVQAPPLPVSPEQLQQSELQQSELQQSELRQSELQHPELQQEQTTSSGSTACGLHPASPQLAKATPSAVTSLATNAPRPNDEPALRFRDADDSFGTLVDCRDVAFTSDGRLLLAALKHGLKQYEPSGRKLATWRPPRGLEGNAAIVSSVDVLAVGSDGSSSGATAEELVVVSLIDLQCVVVLRPDRAATGRGCCYVEQLRVGLQLHPFRVSSFGRRFAVAGANMSDSRTSRGYHVVVGREWSPGPHVELFELTSQSPPAASGAGAVAAASADRLLQLQFEHDVTSLALTDRCLVVLSKRPDERSYAGAIHVMEAHDYDGQRLWSVDSTHELLDVCSSPASAAGSLVIYVTMPRRERVCAYSAENGRWLADVLSSSSHTVSSPGRLSLGRSQGQRALALLIAQDAVAVYRAIVSTTAAAASV